MDGLPLSYMNNGVGHGHGRSPRPRFQFGALFVLPQAIP